MLKKLLPLCLAAALLAGCGASAQKPAVPSDAAAPPAAVTQATAEQAAGFTVGTLHAGADIRFGVPVAEDPYRSDAYYEIPRLNLYNAAGNGLIVRTDLGTGVQSPVCQNPGCAHNSTDCPAFLDCFINDTLAAIDGEVYLIHQAMETDTAGVTPADQPGLTTEGKRAIEAWDALAQEPGFIERLPTEAGQPRTRLLELPDAQLYVNWYDENALYGLHVPVETENPESYMVRVDLQTGGTAKAGLPTYVNLIGVAGNRFLISGIDSDMDIRALAKYADTDTFRVLEQNADMVWSMWDMATGAQTPVYRYGADESRPFAGVAGGKLYFFTLAENGLTCKTLMELDPATGQERALLDPMPAGGLWPSEMLPLGLDGNGESRPGLLWLQGYAAGGQVSANCLVEPQSGTVHTITQRVLRGGTEAMPYPLAQAADGRWLVALETMEGASYDRCRYGLIAPADFLAGSEEYQLVDMYEPDGT